ncbi:hypothetical protein [Actinomadura verrucosospora]|uniref:Uncharacterized protein n=1 Tax=Actinomadura verrucosospora TaxID=46165 RepID=A0A7D3VUH9_ACTVE|nr:hypothetical protein [Actinomadura verrucosospora]QKG23233.1 hypothetical protein ACTIVE_4876 [Actinomadura verrucosospora]
MIFVVAAFAAALAWTGNAAARPAAAAATQTVTVKYGPWTIPGGTMDRPGELPNVVTAAPKPCSNCDIVGEKPDLVYADGSTADMNTGPMLHHFVISNLAAHDTVCPFSPLGDRIWASGDERTEKTMPDGYGVPVKSYDRWAMLTDLMNYSADPKTVYISITYTIAGAGSTTPVRSLWLDAGGCLTSDYSVPAGPSTHAWTWTSTVGGRIVFANGHQHAGGVHVTAADATTGAPICDSPATYDTMGGMRTIVKMGTCSGDPLATVARGDRLTVTSYYDSPTAKNDVMGIVHAYIAEG